MDKHTEMQAVVCHGPKDYRLERIGKPKARPNELAVSYTHLTLPTSDLV